MAEADSKGKNITGTERAAVLLMTLGEQDAAAILKHMSPKEVQRVGEAMATMSNVNRETVDHVLAQFCDTVDEQTELGIGNEDYLRNVLVSALGEDKAGNVIDRILMGHNAKGLETLKWMEPRAIAELIRLEHPQIIAIVLSYLESDHAAEVLSALPENMRTDVVIRVATLDGIQPSALHELDETLEKQFAGHADSLKSAGVGGVKTVANLLNFVDTSLESQIMDMVKQQDEELGQNIQEQMFVFDNLIDVDDRGIQSLLREISSENLIVALKGADESVKDKIVKNMSKRASEMLLDDLDAKGPVRLSEVETAQKEILTVARRMAESGEISLGGSGDEFV
ncbi:MAG: flagellar motor switch protein FliG [Thiohalophilus sp.]|uniref:flagellar motor switch protein FliG n=1 Tax=Thiohalophilus sp. TaxID=3028392 RepID=UPI00286FF9C0|nr:flagellar motor switch protein FliG [Thiohalophilus sp.]MDR9435743.1 flagellar motor switch protein FliG [Thiohalophilus sp.]